MKHKNQKIMSKIFLYAATATFAAALLFALVACNSKPKTPANSAPCYDMRLTYDSDAHLLTASQEVLFFPSEDMRTNRLVFRLYANAFDKQHDAIDVLSVKIDRRTADFEIYGADNSFLSVPFSPTIGQACCVSFSYVVAVPKGDARLGYDEHAARLALFYPILARYENDWREDAFSEIGDPFFADAASYYVTLDADASLAIACSGQKTETSSDGERQTVEIEADNIRDFALSVGKFDELKTTVPLVGRSVDASYFFYNDPDPESSLRRACEALTAFSSAFGCYPYPTFCVAQGELDAGGMEYGAFAVVSPARTEDYLDAIAHETAHQWWYGAVGSDQLSSAWLDEGLSEFCTYYFYYLTGDRSTYFAAMRELSAYYARFDELKLTAGFDGRMSRPLSTFLTEGEYVAVAYAKGALFFHSLLSVLGQKKLDAALLAYFGANLFSVADEEALLAAFETVEYRIGPLLHSYAQDVTLL